MRPYRICSRCIMDTTDSSIEFSAEGICNHCRSAEKSIGMYPHNLDAESKRRELERIVERIKTDGKGREYDCIIGVSGGVDSTYVAYLTKTLGLRPLAVHLDNGWDSELAVHNIEKTLKNLSIDLFTYVINWEEFKDLQLAFLKASTPDSEIPTDHAIQATLFNAVSKHSVKYIIIGVNFSTESILPASWSNGHYDWKYIKNIHKRFGKVQLRTFPNLSYPKLFYYRIIKGIKYVNILDYIDYIKEDAMKILTDELGWQYYGGKHYESVYTKFFQSYILPSKFGFDKRKAHLSSLICSGQITREEALREIGKPPYNESELREDKQYVINKFGISEKEFREIMSQPAKSFYDYPSYEKSWYYSLVKKAVAVLKKRIAQI